VRESGSSSAVEQAVAAATTCRAATRRHMPERAWHLYGVLFSAFTLRVKVLIWRVTSVRPATASDQGLLKEVYREVCGANSSWWGSGARRQTSAATCSTAAARTGRQLAVVRPGLHRIGLLDPAHRVFGGVLPRLWKGLVVVESSMKRSAWRSQWRWRGSLIVHPAGRRTIRKRKRCRRIPRMLQVRPPSHSLRPFAALGEPCMNVSMAVDCLG
jgi:hypothetical protein